MKNILCATVCLFLVFLTASAWAGDTSSSPEPYWKWFLTDTGKSVSAPLRWNGREWITAGSISAAAVGLYAYDGQIRRWVKDEWTRDGDHVTDYIEPFGNGKYLAPALGIYYGYGYAADDSGAKNAAKLGFEGYVVSGLMVNVLKYATHRHRPNSGDPRSTWDGPSFENDNLSFPSGHASSAFAVAAVLSSEYPESATVSVVSYGLATLVAASRVYDDKHWASDVLVGSAIGYFTGKAVYGWHSDDMAREVTVTPLPLAGGGVLMVSLRY
jgi:membrane-associated phospholipid phosphatase